MDERVIYEDRASERQSELNKERGFRIIRKIDLGVRIIEEHPDFCKVELLSNDKPVKGCRPKCMTWEEWREGKFTDELHIVYHFEGRFAHF